MLQNSSGNVKLEINYKTLYLTIDLVEVGPNHDVCVCVSSADIKPQRWRNSWRSSQTSTCSLSSELLFITSHSVVLVESIIRLFVPVLVT